MPTASASGFRITPAVKKEIVKIIDERIREAHVTKEDFSELKAIVKDIGVKVGELAEAQKRTEHRVEELSEAQRDLATSLNELAEAQKKTEISVKLLVDGLQATRDEVGGLARSMGYAFENEVYRVVPKLLQERYELIIKDKMIREEIGGKEVNLFAQATRNGTDVLIVGQAKLRLDERRKSKQGDVFDELEAKVRAVQQEYGDVEIVRLLVTHYATKGFLANAEARGVIVLQSFEW